MNTPDILILGGGIIGCTLARELARSARKVVSLERARAGAAASSAAAGLLTPTFSAPKLDELVDLCFQSAAMYESWVQTLRSEGAGDVGFQRAGLLDVWLGAEQAGEARKSLAMQARPGRRAEVLGSDQVRQSEPAIGVAVDGALWFPDDAQVDPVRLSREAACSAERAGVIIREREPVHLLDRVGEEIRAVHTTQGVYHPGLVVLAAGAWSGSLLDAIGVRLLTLPVKGQMLEADCRIAPVRAPVNIGEALFVPRPDGSMKLGVTVEHAGFDERVTLDGLRTILTNAAAVVPAVGNLSFARAWAGLRPATPDGWPYLGPLPPLRNLWVSTGHYRKGILLAPLCARLLAQSIVAGKLVPELEPFQPRRVVK